MWLAVDTLLREQSNETCSLDDFARAFFGVNDGSMTTRTYTADDVVRTLSALAEYDWAAFLDDSLHRREAGAPLEGLERGGYRLIYRSYRNDFCRSFDTLNGQLDLRFSIGLTLTDNGTVQEVMWGSAAFDAGLTADSTIQRVNGQVYSALLMGETIEAATDGGSITLTVKARPQSKPREVAVNYREGNRFPHLEGITGSRSRLDEIFTAV